MNFRRYHVSKNLFDWNRLVNGYHLDPQTGLPTTHLMRVSILQPIDVSQLTTAVLSYESVDVQVLYAMYSILTTDNTLIRRVTSVTSGSSLDLSGGDKLYIAFYNGASSGATAITKDNITNIMLNTGSTPQPYEPYSSEVWHDIPYYIHKTATDTLTLPAVIYPNDTSITVGIKGQSSQNGTPTPQNPVDVLGTGERTGNLLNPSDILYNMQFDTSSNPPAFVPSDTLNCSNYISVTTGTYLRMFNNVAVGNWFYEFDANKNFLRTKSPGEGAPMVISNDASYIVFNISKTVDINKYMFARTSTPLPYEPYGYKIPISSANTTTPVYLGEVQTTRKIKKLVLDGVNDGEWKKSSTRTGSFYLYIGANVAVSFGICDRAINVRTVEQYDSFGKMLIESSGSSKLLNLWLFNTDISLADFKTYLQQQYTAGTPVCVWYVLAEPTTGIVNEPLRKIGDYADEVSGITIPTIAGANTLSVGTTLQPSEVTVNYKGWHPVQSVHEAENGAWT